LMIDREIGDVGSSEPLADRRIHVGADAQGHRSPVMRRQALTVRLPGAGKAPMTNPSRFCQVGRVTWGRKAPNHVRRAWGTASPRPGGRIGWCSIRCFESVGGSHTRRTACDGLNHPHTARRSR
jgi:hypothetical protein